MEGDRWIALVAGLLDDHPPTDEAGWLEFARNLPQPDVYEAVKNAEPISDIALYKFPSHLRRHYEKMRDFPDGLVALGDSVCSFNPMYGQGMTTAAIGALHLGEHVERARDLNGLSRRFQSGLAKLTNDPWMMSTGEDFRYPDVVGDRPFGNSVMQWYTGRVHRAAAASAEVSNLFYRAMHMLSPPTALMSPGMIVRVLRNS
jgi:2-polyprenyl-6-methoxyphenol hydroxylase-like FAD-dependent oxidoreductase